MSPIKILRLQGKEIIPYLDNLVQLRLTVFKEYPYLYEGNLEAENNFLKKFSDCPEAILLVVLSADKVVGIATALPLSFESTHIKQPFIDQGLDIEKIFYLSEQILMSEFRGQGIGGKLSIEMEETIKGFHKYSTIAFCAIKRENNHPLCPQDYRSLDDYYKKYGYKKHPELVAQTAWPEIGTTEKINHNLVFWLKII